MRCKPIDCTKESATTSSVLALFWITKVLMLLNWQYETITLEY